MKPSAKAFSALAAFLGAFFGVVWVKTQVIRTGYRITELKATLRALEFDLAKAEVKLGTLRAHAQTQAQQAHLLFPDEYPPQSVRYKNSP